MFSFFKKKEPTIKIIDKVWMNEVGKWNGCLGMLRDDPKIIFVTWFDETFVSLNNFLQHHQYLHNVISYRQVTFVDANKYVFAEHYPLISKEEELFNKLQLHKVIILSALTEPIFIHFGGERISELLHKLGIQDEEEIEHSFITASIKKALQKIAQNIIVDNAATSQQEWMNKNVK